MEAKGFLVEEKRKHIHFIYVDLAGRTTAARTMISHGAGSDDIGDNLLGRMAGQVGLRRAELLDLIDCPMTREEFDARTTADGGTG